MASERPQKPKSFRLGFRPLLTSPLQSIFNTMDRIIFFTLRSAPTFRVLVRKKITKKTQKSGLQKPKFFDETWSTLAANFSSQTHFGGRRFRKSDLKVRLGYFSLQWPNYGLLWEIRKKWLKFLLQNMKKIRVVNRALFSLIFSLQRSEGVILTQFDEF